MIGWLLQTKKGVFSFYLSVQWVFYTTKILTKENKLLYSKTTGWFVYKSLTSATYIQVPKRWGPHHRMKDSTSQTYRKKRGKEGPGLKKLNNSSYKSDMIVTKIPVQDPDHRRPISQLPVASIW